MLDQEQLAREIQRLANDPWLAILLDQADEQIMGDWMRTEAGESLRREQLWHEMAGVLRLRLRLKVAQDNETIATARAQARDEVEHEGD